MKSQTGEMNFLNVELSLFFIQNIFYEENIRTTYIVTTLKLQPKFINKFVQSSV